VIPKLLIKNYQSHRESEFEFHPGVNMIIGMSDSGKSSVFRSLKLAILNRPLGLGFHSNFAKKEDPTEVSITVQDGNSTTKISRLRSETVNEYFTNETRYAAFGTEVPDEITEILNISDINYQFQMDSPFLFSESPGVVARYLNKIVNLDKIDVALQSIASKKRQNESEIKFQQERITELDLGIKAFPNLESIGVKISELENISEELNNYRYSKEILSNLIDSIQESELKIEKVKIISKLAPKIRNLEKVLSGKQSLESRYDDLFKMVRNIEGIQWKIATERIVTSKHSRFLELETLGTELSGLQYTRNLLFKSVSDIDKCEAKIKTTKQFIKGESDRLKKSLGDICPLCEKPIEG